MANNVAGGTGQVPSLIPADSAETHPIDVAAQFHLHQQQQHQPQPQNPTIHTQSEKPYRRLETSMSNQQARPRTPVLPALSPATAEILARVQSETAASEKQKGPEAPNKRMMQSSSIVNPVNGTATTMDRAGAPPSTFDKSKLKSAFASVLTPKSRVPPSQNSKSSNGAPLISKPSNSGNSSLVSSSLQTPSDAVVVETTPVDPEIPPCHVADSAESIAIPKLIRPQESTSQIAAKKLKAPKPVSSPMATAKSSTAVPPTKTNSSTRRKHTYILADGTVRSSGKGLGRGRPGIKRGPRTPRLLINGRRPVSFLDAIIDMLNEPQTQRSKKRKRSGRSDRKENGKIPTSEGSEPESEEYAPQATQTRSGRHTQRPATFVPTIESPASKRPRLSDHGRKSPTKGNTDRGKELSALCEHCLRGHAPLGNAIVFCDGCDKCWHQRCHRPMIPKELVVDTAKEWFCTNCTGTPRAMGIDAQPLLQQGGEGLGEEVHLETASPSTGSKPSRAATGPSPELLIPPLHRLVAGHSLTKEQCGSYFKSLSRERLIELLCHAADIDRDLPIFLPPTPTTASHDPEPPRPTADSTETSTSKARSIQWKFYPTPSQEFSDFGGDDDDDEYNYEHAKLYPKPGDGVKLPPDSEDLDMLLEGPECKTFSHTLRSAETRSGLGIGDFRVINRTALRP